MNKIRIIINNGDKCSAVLLALSAVKGQAK